VASDSSVNIAVEFKPYGVRLAFRPIVLSGGRISLQLSTEVSELTQEGAFTLGRHRRRRPGHSRPEGAPRLENPPSNCPRAGR
jgi:Flp pilus assembly secretin CpaC